MDEKNIKKIETPTLVIKDNVLKYKNSIIQISNITKCEIAPEPKKPYPLWIFAGFIIGALMLFNKNYTLISLVILAICGTIFYIIFSKNADPKTYFILELNSGSIILFSSSDKNFLWEAESAIINCFNDKNEVCVINFSDCTITHSQIGNENRMHNSEV